MIVGERIIINRGETVGDDYSLTTHSLSVQKHSYEIMSYCLLFCV